MSETAPEAELLRVLLSARESARDALTAAECELILQTCRDVAAMTPDLPGAQPSLTARHGAELLLELSLPQVDAVLRAELAGAVEAMAARWRP